jgi:hypothetical protein
MKVEVKENEVKASSKYPYLGKLQGYGTIVLFNEPAIGIVLNDSETHYQGYYSNVWVEKDFTPFNGTITLSND